MYKKIKTIYIYLLLYFSGSILFLDRYPFMHSDESWLSDLSRNIMESHSMRVTESVFDLYPRFPHAIKIVFHLIQILFMQFFEYDLFTFRLVSLVFACLALLFFHKTVSEYRNEKSALFCTILLSLNIQFIYASHFARQEIILLFIEIAALYFFLRKKYPLVTILCGIGIGIHPNAFIIAVTIGTFYLVEYFSKQISIKTVIHYIAGLAGFALFFIKLSLILDPNFFSNYLSYGSGLSVNLSLAEKFRTFDDFWLKIYKMISATYYTPDIRIYFYIFILTFVLILVKKRTLKNITIVLAIAALNLAIIMIGRYNPTSIIFIFPLFYLLISEIDNRYFIAILLIVSLVNSAVNIRPYLNDDYQDYLDRISEYVEPDSKVLANLNCAYYFDNGSLLDYRNLYYMKENNINFSEYIRNNKIEYIIYSEEMDFIYNRRPVWNIVYGNLYYYYDDMQEFLNDECELVGEFTDSTYSMRIVRYQGSEYSVRIYKVKNKQEASNGFLFYQFVDFQYLFLEFQGVPVPGIWHSVDDCICDGCRQVSKYNDLVRQEQRLIDVMGDKKYCSTDFPADVQDQILQIRPGLHIQTCKRFIHAQYLRFQDQGPGNRYPLFLTAGKLIGVTFLISFQAYEFKVFFGFHTLFSLVRLIIEGEHDVFKHCQPGKELIEVLKDHNLVPAWSHKALIIDFPLTWSVKSHYNIQQG